MSPIEYIEKGILDGNWEDVCTGYELLTGGLLTPPEENVEINELKVAIRDIRDIISDLSVPEKPTKKKKHTPKKTRKKKSVPVVDESHLITEEPDPEEVERNKILAERANRNKLKIKRPVVKTYKVKCNECEETFESDRRDEEMGQKCRKCLNNKKSRFA